MKRWHLALLTTLCIMMASESQAQVELPQPTFGTLAVRLQQDGLLTGTIGHIDPSSLDLVPIEGVDVTFRQNGRVVARAESTADGQIAVRGLSPQAVYSVVAQAEHEGQRWFMAHGVSVLSAEGGQASAALSRKPAYRLVAATAARKLNLESMAQPSVGLAMIPMGDLGFGQDDTSASVLGGAAAPVGGGGGGGGGLGGGGLAAAAVAAAVAVAAADDDNVGLATPFRP